jgi:GTPase SAR1 family protein
VSSLTDAEKQELENSKQIDRAVRDAKEEYDNVVKLLLLGAGESGKSTIFKQMKILFGEGFSMEDKMEAKIQININIFDSMVNLCNAVEDLGLFGELQDTRSFEQFLSIAERSNPEHISKQNAKMITRLWQDPAIQKAWSMRASFQVLEAASSFLDRVEEISSDGFIPSEHDILLARVKTTGIKEDRYNIHGSIFEMYDVGGQRNERRKWMHCFDGVNAVIFVAALSEYDQTLFEDDVTNRMVEALTLFESICHHPSFKSISIILFLNKRDLFSEKIQHVPIESIDEFADYRGKPNDYKEGVDFFTRKFQERSGINARPEQLGERHLYTHVTCATDTSNIEFVFNACTEIILNDNIKDTFLA